MPCISVTEYDELAENPKFKRLFEALVTLAAFVTLASSFLVLRIPDSRDQVAGCTAYFGSIVLQQRLEGVASPSNDIG